METEHSATVRRGVFPHFYCAEVTYFSRACDYPVIPVGGLTLTLTVTLGQSAIVQRTGLHERSRTVAISANQRRPPEHEHVRFIE